MKSVKSIGVWPPMSEGHVDKRERELETVKAGAEAAAGNFIMEVEQSVVLSQPHKNLLGETWLWDVWL